MTESDAIPLPTCLGLAMPQPKVFYKLLNGLVEYGITFMLFEL